MYLGRLKISFNHGYVFIHIFVPTCLPNGSQAELTGLWVVTQCPTATSQLWHPQS